MLVQLPPGTRVGRIHWKSEFGIANRVAGRFAAPPFYLVGDAAYIHSGIGARGMNLGIEDVWIFAELYHQGQLNSYDALRRPIVEKLVGQICRAMSVPRPGTLAGACRKALPAVAGKTRQARGRPNGPYITMLPGPAGAEGAIRSCFFHEPSPTFSSWMRAFTSVPAQLAAS